MRKIAYHEITGVIRCVSGLRIGGSDDLHALERAGKLDGLLAG